VGIICCSECGPNFVDLSIGVVVLGNPGSDLCVIASSACFTWLGVTYTNGTGLRGDTVLAGWRYFRVNEIEVFEITD
jgi:hypothetical protein